MAEKQTIKGKVVGNQINDINHDDGKESIVEISFPSGLGNQQILWSGWLPIGAEVELTVKVK